MDTIKTMKIIIVIIMIITVVVKIVVIIMIIMIVMIESNTKHYFKNTIWVKVSLELAFYRNVNETWRIS